MTLAAVAVAATVNAQLYIGGTFGFTSTNNKTEVTAGTTTSTEVTTTRYNFTPEVGYKLNDKMAVGMTIGLSGFSRENPVVAPTTKDEDTQFRLEFAPYFRFIFANWGKVSLFADGEVGFYTGTTKNEVTAGTTVSTENKEHGFHIAVKPGIMYQPTKQISLVAKLGNGFGFWNEVTERPVTAPVTDDKTTVNTFGLNLSSLGLSIGAYYNF